MILMLPYYLLGNFHCLGMCGPMAMMLGKHRYRNLYFLGRLTSFTLAALIAGSMGAIIGEYLQRFHLSALISLLFGVSIILFTLCGSLASAIKPPFFSQQKMTALMLQDTPLATFLFGFCTVFLPCGQTLVVFSYCALTGSALEGGANGFLFALLTSPSLYVAMRAKGLVQKLGNKAALATTLLAVAVGTLAILRGLADLGAIQHLVLNAHYHIVLY